MIPSISGRHGFTSAATVSKAVMQASQSLSVMTTRLDLIVAKRLVIVALLSM